MIGSKWPYSCSFVGSYLEDLFNIDSSVVAVKLFLRAFSASMQCIHTAVSTRLLLEKIAFHLIGQV